MRNGRGRRKVEAESVGEGHVRRTRKGNEVVNVFQRFQNVSVKRTVERNLGNGRSGSGSRVYLLRSSQ